MGFVDRGGGREAKGASLRRSKKNPGAPAAKKGGAVKSHTSPDTRVPPVAPACLSLPPGEVPWQVDASVAVLARKLETDRDQLMPRAAQESQVAAALTWCADLERQEALLELCRQQRAAPLSSSSGLLYCLVGVHVNNVERTHKKVQEGWVENVLAWGRNGEVVGVLSGLNLGRDAGTHFAQEWLLEQLWRVAATLQVPLVLHIGDDHFSNGNQHPRQQQQHEGGGQVACTADRAAELLTEFINRAKGITSTAADVGGPTMPTAVVLHNGIGALAASPALRELVQRHIPSKEAITHLAATAAKAEESTQMPMYVLATAEGLTQRETGDEENNTAVIPEKDEGEKAEHGKESTFNPLFAETLRAHVDLSQLLIGTGSPWNTPQNIPDAYICTMPNEPANYCHVVKAIHAAITQGAHTTSASPLPLALQELQRIVRDNFVRVFLNPATSASSPPEASHTAMRNPDEDVSVHDTATKHGAQPRMHLDPHVVSVTGAIPAAPDSHRYYLCLKCRRRLFPAQSLLTHAPDAAVAQFAGRHSKRPSKPNACGTMCFLPITENANGEWGVCAPSVGGDSVRIQHIHGTVLCGGCGAKLGTAGEDAPCPCGCIIPGRTARIAACKVEAPVRKTGGDLEELLAHAALEREQLRHEEDPTGESGSDTEGGVRRRKEPKKNVKANNRSNFTHFRNKNFAPRQQSQKGGGGEDEEERDADEEESDAAGSGNDMGQQTMQQTGGRRNRRKNAKRQGMRGDNDKDEDEK